MADRMVVDAHVHLMPGRLGDAIRSFFREHIGDRLVYPHTHRQVLDHLAAEGVDVVWNLPYAHRSGVAAPLNDDIVEISDRFAGHPVRVVPGCTVHPDDPDPASDLRRAIESGARVLKLHCSVGSYAIDDPRLAPALDVAGSAALPVVVHAGHGVSGMTACHELDALGRTADRHPDTIFVLAHVGHGAAVDGVALLERCRNVWADLTPVVDSQVAIDDEILVRHAGRLMLGSDAPNTGCRVGDLVARIVDGELSDADTTAILGGNALRLVPV